MKIFLTTLLMAGLATAGHTETLSGLCIRHHGNVGLYDRMAAERNVPAHFANAHANFGLEPLAIPVYQGNQ